MTSILPNYQLVGGLWCRLDVTGGASSPLRWLLCAYCPKCSWRATVLSEFGIAPGLSILLFAGFSHGCMESHGSDTTGVNRHSDA